MEKYYKNVYKKSYLLLNWWPMNHNQIPRVITVDKNAAYPPAINELKNDKILPKNVGRPPLYG
jgi:hypothetical protein